MKDAAQVELAEKIYAEAENNIDVILDDRDERPGFQI